jgi:hypothetical protein
LIAVLKVSHTYLIRKHKTILQYPSLLQSQLDPRIVSGSIDFGRRFPKAKEGVFHLHVRVCAVADWGIFEKLREKKGVFAHSLDRL